MLPPFIIEQIRKREEDERRRRHEGVKELHLPVPEPFGPPRGRPAAEEDRGRDRGIVIIEL